MDDDNDLPPRRWSWPLVLAIPLVLAGAGGLLAYTRCNARRALETTRGQPEGAVVVRGDRAMLVLVDRVGRGASAFRLAALDPDTGKPVNQRVIDESARCWAASPGRMWCADADSRTHLVAVPSFDAVAASDGDRTWLGRDERGCTFADSIPLGDDHLVFGRGTQRRPLVRAAAPQGSLPGTPDFLAPAFLRVDDPALLLVQHDASLERPGALQLTRVGDDLHAMWTAELPGRCETAHVVGGKLVITTVDPAARALAIELTTGQVAWRFAF
jgi:hypothetical protein